MTFGDTVYVLDIETEKVIAEFAGFSEVSNVVFVDNIALVSSSFVKELVFVNIKTLKELKRESLPEGISEFNIY